MSKEIVMNAKNNLMVKKFTLLQALLGFSLMVCILISGCGSNESQASPTLDVETIQTQAVGTFAAGLTQTALAQPTETPTQTGTPTPTSTSTPALTDTPTATISSVGIVPTSTCYGMAFVADVTILDNTTMNPGETFTKTWRVRNNGSCTWEAGFKLVFLGGESMGGSSLTLEGAVNPGTETELSVTLTAPTEAGTYRSNWIMTDFGGTYFGDEVYVLIVVSGSATSTPTVQPSATLTPTATVTQEP
jgi:hypothetical protein